MQFPRKIYTDDQGQDIAEYAVMLAVILVIVIGTVRLIGEERQQRIFRCCQYSRLSVGQICSSW
jgi:Flp pilus assembly pilin Flp